jgi:UDP-glucose 4-epimerase
LSGVTSSDGERRLVVLVTGGSGFIGSHVVDRLCAAGHTPRIYDQRTSPYHTADTIETVVGDLGDLRALERAMAGCDAVIHLAAAADVNEVAANPVGSERCNVRGTLNVLEAARRAKPERVVYASTIWVYSDTPASCHREGLALKPPAHLYTATKLAGEHYCHAYRELYGIDYTILRFGIPYGPRARPAAVVPSFVSRALAGEPLTIAGDGLQSRRFVYVEDLADGVVRALAPVALNRTYNLVSTQDVTIKEIAETVRTVVGDVSIEHVPGRNGDFAGAPVSGDRAAADLGWQATTPFDEGVRRYVEWHRAAAAAAAPARAPSWVGVLARRALLAFACAALAALAVIGVVTLVPVDGDDSPYAIFGTLLVLFMPFVLAGAFSWDETRERWLRVALWLMAVLCLVITVAPWPRFFDRFDHGHPALLLFALSAACAGQITGRAPLRTLLSATGK